MSSNVKLNVTNNGFQDLQQLTNIRKVFEEVSYFENLFGREKFDMIQEAFIEIMKPFEQNFIEGIYDASGIEVGECETNRRPEERLDC